MSVTSWRFGNGHCRAEIQSLGGMLGPVQFRLGDRTVEPFAVAPWAEDATAEHAALPGILKRLRGEWPCVPFGMDEDRPDLPEAWRPAADAPRSSDRWPHGYGSNHAWHLVSRSENRVTIGINYPGEHEVARLVRSVAAREDGAGLDFTLTIHARRPCRLPIGLHPTYMLPAGTGELELDLAEGARAWTFPLAVEPGRTRLVPDQQGADPRRLLAADGAVESAATLPFAGESEDLVLLTGLGGRIGLRYAREAYRVSQSWDPAHFSCCLLWISAQGRRFYPWSGRFRGLGVEPISGAFDLGPAIGASAGTPLARAGVSLGVDLSPDQPLTTRYSIAVSDLS